MSDHPDADISRALATFGAAPALAYRSFAAPAPGSPNGGCPAPHLAAPGSAAAAFPLLGAALPGAALVSLNRGAEATVAAVRPEPVETAHKVVPFAPVDRQPPVVPIDADSLRNLRPRGVTVRVAPADKRDGRSTPSLADVFLMLSDKPAAPVRDVPAENRLRTLLGAL